MLLATFEQNPRELAQVANLHAQAIDGQGGRVEIDVVEVERLRALRDGGLVRQDEAHERGDRAGEGDHQQRVRQVEHRVRIGDLTRHLGRELLYSDEARGRRRHAPHEVRQVRDEGHP